MKGSFARGAQGREIWGLAAIFAFFLVSAYVLERVSQQTVGQDVPSSLNAHGAGAKALYLLLAKEGYHVDRFDRSWMQLPEKPAILVVTEPLSPDRKPDTPELGALKNWVKAGGSVLYYMDAGGGKPLFGVWGSNAAAGAPGLVPPLNTNSPYMRGVTNIHVDSPVRLINTTPAAAEILARDGAGAVVIHERIGKGDATIVASSAAFNNTGISQADNVILAVDAVAATAMRTDGRVLFDEYHHGVGFDSADSNRDTSEGLIAATPLPLRLAFYEVIALTLLLIYNGNRRFGEARTVVRSEFRASTDYVASMAQLLRRAHAGDVAALALYHRFVRDLRASLQVSPDTPAAQLPELAARGGNVSLQAITELIEKCERIEAGYRPREAEATALARMIDNMRRSCNIGGVE